MASFCQHQFKFWVSTASPMRAEVLHKAFLGAALLYTLRLPSGQQVLSLVPSHHNHAVAFRHEQGAVV